MKAKLWILVILFFAGLSGAAFGQVNTITYFGSGTLAGPHALVFGGKSYNYTADAVTNPLTNNTSSNNYLSASATFVGTSLQVIIEHHKVGFNTLKAGFIIPDWSPEMTTLMNQSYSFLNVDSTSPPPDEFYTRVTRYNLSGFIEEPPTFTSSSLSLNLLQVRYDNGLPAIERFQGVVTQWEGPLMNSTLFQRFQATINFTGPPAPIPEPVTYVKIFGIIAIVLVIVRRLTQPSLVT